MKELAEAALNAAQVKGASYADVRLDQHVQQDIVVKNGQLAAVSDDASEGFGVRVIVDGAWGFAGSSRVLVPQWLTSITTSCARAWRTAFTNPSCTTR